MHSLVCRDFTVPFCQRTSGDVIRPGLSRIPALIFPEWRMGKDVIITLDIVTEFRHTGTHQSLTYESKHREEMKCSVIGLKYEPVR